LFDDDNTSLNETLPDLNKEEISKLQEKMNHDEKYEFHNILGENEEDQDDKFSKIA